MAKQFKLTVGVKRACWILGIGDALRARGNTANVLMLASPTAAMFRIKVGARVSVLERRAHDATRCTRGRWERIDDSPTPCNAREWTKLAKHWAWVADSLSPGCTVYDWAGDDQKDENRCHTRTHANRLVPGFGGPGRGTICKGRPTSQEAFGFSPASGRRAATSDASRRAEARDRARVRRAERFCPEMNDSEWLKVNRRVGRN